MTGYGPELLDRLTTSVVGRRRELESIVAALAAGRHLLLEGPPGTGKSTVLRAIAEESGAGFEFVEGNAELTPARLVGAFDPAVVLADGYSPDVFIDGPLVAALRDGSLLYVEELNRVPEETLNVLITVMSEGEVHVPRLGRIAATDGFRLVAAMNPFDAVGTARIASAVYDRCCRLAMGYQDHDEEAAIVERRADGAAAVLGDAGTGPQWPWCATAGPTPTCGPVRRCAARSTSRWSPRELAALRGCDVLDPSVTLDAALLALSGRIRVREGCGRSAEDVVTELWRRHFEHVRSGRRRRRTRRRRGTGRHPGKA